MTLPVWCWAFAWLPATFPLWGWLIYQEWSDAKRAREIADAFRECGRRYDCERAARRAAENGDATTQETR